jgi:outer membrane protein assembly factor BamA
LGPGSSGSRNDFNEANFKIALNTEFRFKILKDLKGALFIDAGNIWNLLDEEKDPASVFNNFNSLKNIAVGSGFGFRYDLNFFVIRIDLGYKTYDPAQNEDKRWFRKYNFSQTVLNIGINYPF